MASNYLRLLAATICTIICLANSATATTLSDGLLAWYPFDGNAVDESGNGNDGTVINTALSTDRNGDADSAYDFNGINSEIDIGAGVKPALAHTVNLWLQTDTFGFIPIFRNDLVDGGSFRHGTFIGLRDTETVSVISFSGFSFQGSRYSAVAPDNSIVAGEWTMITAINDTRGNQRLFINGMEVVTTPGTGTGSGFTYSAATGSIGHVDPTPNNVGVFANTSFDGKIDDVGVWNRSLTDSEITDLFDGLDPLGTTTAVPLPPSMALLLGALGCVGSIRKFRKAG